MKIKRYLAHDMQEALIRIKADLGNDAVILSTKKVRQKGVLGFFKKPLVEVTAACEEDKVKEFNAKSKKTDDVAFSLQFNQMKELEKKIDHLEKTIKQIIERSDVSPQTNYANKKNFVEILNQNMRKNGVDDQVLEEIIKKLNTDDSINNMVNTLYKEIKDMLGAPQIISPGGKKPYIVFFVGPTGVGKTTTIAKIAAKLMFEYGKSVGFITADTYRIAAVEQLKTYADIMNIKIKVWYELDEFEQLIDHFAEHDVVLVDTAGRSHKNQDHINELQRFVEKAKPDEVYLLLSATTQPYIFKEIIQTYSFIQSYKVIITKVDEVSVYGNILNIRYYSQKPIAYITTGQNVPDDIQEFDPDSYVKLIMGSRTV